LTPKGRQVVAGIAHDIHSEYDAAAIDIVGYTDRFGSAAYNQQLSRRRAHAVADALVANGIAAAAISSHGGGESNPVVTCPGQQATAAVKACLQPNRRVAIRVENRR